MTPKILFLVPKDSMDDKQLKYYRTVYPDVLFEFSDPYDPIPLVEEKLSEGPLIVAGRGNSATVIRKKFPNIHVVQIKITGYDIIRSLDKYNIAGTTIAVITNNLEISGLNIFEKLYSIRIISFLMVPFVNLENVIRDAMHQGADYILGGAITCKIANEMKISAKAIPLVLGNETLISTIHEIRQVQEAIKVENSRQNFISQLFDSIDNGIISVDHNGSIMLVNSIASRMLQMQSHHLIGKDIEAILGINNSDEAETIININDNKILVTHNPLQNENQESVIIYTLRELSYIESLKTQIRRVEYNNNKHLARFNFKNIIGKSASIRNAIRIGKSYGNTDSNVLISGETGTGKEMFAQSIHNAGSRCNNAFVAVNCAALPETLLESELFGYVEGAFTGANRKGKPGLFEIAHNGTIFLDEISEISYTSQGKLLRVLQEKYIVRLGSQKIIPINVRVIAATNQNLRELVEKKKFREDLYYRLNVLNMVIPPVREREGDAVVLLNYFLKKFGSNVSLSDNAADFINQYAWYGNVREISNLAERIVATTTSMIITREQIENLLDLQPYSKQSTSQLLTPLQLREETQAEEIKNAIRQANGNMGRAADILKINRSTLWRRMKKLNMTSP
ncbi:MAG: sigma 54-interacting transcriptional regulator [Prolixibacteraceae bacterium]|jgi:transcriptional regulator with PAS, ATPase and Fis domain|nr:sigma 54-interacting transcriptional regulator [Prolixibacteraceae bacterium]